MYIKNIFSNFMNLCSKENKQIILDSISMNQHDSTLLFRKSYDNHFYVVTSDKSAGFSQTCDILTEYPFETYFYYNKRELRHEVSFKLFNKKNTNEQLFVSFFETDDGKLNIDNARNSLKIKLNSVYKDNLKQSQLNYYVFNFEDIITTIIQNYTKTVDEIKDILLIQNDIDVDNSKDDLIKSICKNIYTYNSLKTPILKNNKKLKIS